MKKIFAVVNGIIGCALLHAQNISNHGNRFEQLGSLLPTPNEYRAADGAPGPRYWKQRYYYDIICELNYEKT